MIPRAQSRSSNIATKTPGRFHPVAQLQARHGRWTAAAPVAPVAFRAPRTGRLLKRGPKVRVPFPEITEDFFQNTGDICCYWHATMLLCFIVRIQYSEIPLGFIKHGWLENPL